MQRSVNAPLNEVIPLLFSAVGVMLKTGNGPFKMSLMLIVQQFPYSITNSSYIFGDMLMRGNNTAPHRIASLIKHAEE